MYKLKNILMLLLLASLAITVQITVPACDDNNTDDNTVRVNEPDNDYYIEVELLGIGTVGCGSGVVMLGEQYVTDADVQINGHSFSCEGDEDYAEYTDETNAISYVAGTNYELKVKLDGETIASGSAKMPSTPVITNISSPYYQTLNTNLPVQWTKVKNATSVALYLATEAVDGIVYYSGAFDPIINAITIPSTVFDSAGVFLLFIEAYHGLLPGYEAEFDPETWGYNIEGSSGVFLASTLYPVDYDDGGFIVEVGEATRRAVAAGVPAEDLLRKFRRLRNRIIRQ